MKTIKRYLFQISLLPLIVLSLVSCSPSEEQPMINKNPVEATLVDKTIDVSDTDELLDAVAMMMEEPANYKLILQEGTYTTSEMLRFRGGSLSISGKGNGAVISCTNMHDEVVLFADHKSVSLNNLSMKHDPPNPGEGYVCSGSVVVAVDVDSLTFDGCSLDGCGTWAISLGDGTKNVSFKNGEITNCSVGILHGGQNCLFTNSVIHNNYFNSTAYYEDEKWGSLIYQTGNGKVTITDCEFKENRHKTFISPKGVLEQSNNVFSDNVFPDPS